MLTYRDLGVIINKMSEEELGQNVTVRDDNRAEFYSNINIHTTASDDVLDKGHFYLSFDSLFDDGFTYGRTN